MRFASREFSTGGILLPHQKPSSLYLTHSGFANSPFLWTSLFGAHNGDLHEQCIQHSPGRHGLAWRGAAAQAQAQEVVRLGNIKLAHFGAVSYIKEIAPKCGIKVEEKVFAKGLDVMQAIIAGELDVGATASEAAISGRAGGAPIFVVAGFATGGARLVAQPGQNISERRPAQGQAGRRHARRDPGSAVDGGTAETQTVRRRRARQGRAADVSVLRRPERRAARQADRRHDAVRAAILAGDQQAASGSRC